MSTNDTPSEKKNVCALNQKTANVKPMREKNQVSLSATSLDWTEAKLKRRT